MELGVAVEAAPCELEAGVYEDVAHDALVARLASVERQSRVLEAVLPKLVDAERKCAQLLRQAANECAKAAAESPLVAGYGGFVARRAADHEDLGNALRLEPKAERATAAAKALAAFQAAQQALRWEQRRVRGATTSSDAKSARLSLRAAMRRRDEARLDCALAVADRELEGFDCDRGAVLRRLDLEAAALSRRQRDVDRAREAVAALQCLPSMEDFARATATLEARSFSAAVRILDWDWARRRHPGSSSFHGAFESASPRTRRFALLDDDVPSPAAAAIVLAEATESLAPATVIATLSARRHAPDLTERGPAAFDALAALLSAVFDEAAAKRDAHHAEQALHLASTFYARRPSSSSQERQRTGDGDGADADATRNDEEVRVFLRDVEAFAPTFSDYPDFWDDALLSALKRDLDIRWSSTGPGGASSKAQQQQQDQPWDLALSDAQLRDAVVQIHNSLFGCLSAVLVNMRQIGVPRPDIEAFARKAIHRAQLPRDQRLQLFATLELLMRLEEEDGHSPKDAASSERRPTSERTRRGDVTL